MTEDYSKLNELLVKFNLDLLHIKSETEIEAWSNQHSPPVLDFLVKNLHDVAVQIKTEWEINQ
tara:strand:- start:158 stop:346 length:189 start_codon:yes stop_codon:yes gene_type:complete